MKDLVVTAISETLLALQAAGTLRLAGGVPTFTVEPPKQAAHGDFAVNVAMMLSKAEGKPPRAIAEAIVAGLVDSAVAAAEYASHAAVPEMCVDVGDDDAFDHAYVADGVVDVAADGTWHSVPLGDRKAQAAMRYVAVPREELAVYRVAALQNPLRAPMLAGPAEVYVGGEYVLTTSLDTVAAHGELTLGLGVEQAIKISRNARFAETREGSGVVAMVELVHDIDIDIVNHLARAIEIEVRERVPVPAPGAEVQVEERGVSPTWQVWDQQERGEVIDGGRRWQIVVAGGASAALKAQYVLRLFSNAEIQGGNRREA